jgi:hypothetical protein
MNRKFIIILGVVFTAAMIIGVFINPSLVSSPKSKESNLTLERISSYTSEGEAGGPIVYCSASLQCSRGQIHCNGYQPTSSCSVDVIAKTVTCDLSTSYCTN